MATIPRTIRFLIASISLKVRVVGRLARIAGAIAVNRPQDMAYDGMGRIADIVPLNTWQPPPNLQTRRRSSLPRGSLVRTESHPPRPRPIEGSAVVIGDKQTRFHLDLKKGDRIRIGKVTGTVQDILSDRHLVVKEPIELEAPKSEGSEPVASPPSSQEPDHVQEKGSWGFKVLPKVDQGDIYEAVSQALYEGHSICIFPEGGSHDRPLLLPLKPGVAVMALNTAMMGVEDVLIVPFGIHYYARYKFGSRAVLEIGQPLPIRQELVELYANGNSREAVEELMKEVKDALNNCVVTAPDFETIKAIELCASLYPPERMNMSTERSYQMYQLFSQIFNLCGQEPPALKLKEQILGYNALLEANGVPDSEVWQLKQSAENAFFSMIEKIILLIFVVSVSLPSMIGWGPFKLLLNYMTERHRIAAKAKSSVKISGEDVIASYKIIWTMIFLPICVVTIALITWVTLTSRNWVQLLACLGITVLVVPPMTYEFLRLYGRILPLCRQIRCLYRAIIAELDVWRDRERELIFDRIDMQLKVRHFTRELFDSETMAQALSEKARLASTASLTSFERNAVATASRGSRLLPLKEDLERIIPFVVLDADTRRLNRLKERYIPLVYRSALASREEIL